MYRQFNIQQFYVLPTHFIYVFCVDLRTNNLYFPIQHKLTGFYNRDLTFYIAVVTICTTSLTFNNSTFCPHSVFLCFVWISEQTAIISLYNINWLVFITDLSLYSPVVTICTTSFTFNNSTFCPHTVFMCFVWTWVKIAITFLQDINWLVFITETESIYWAIRTSEIATSKQPLSMLVYTPVTAAKILLACRKPTTNTATFPSFP